MSPGEEIFRFIFVLTKIISMAFFILLILFYLWGAALNYYSESIYACPDKRLITSDEEAISLTKNFIEKKQDFDSYLYEIVRKSKDYNKTRKFDHLHEYGWYVSRKSPSNLFEAEKIEVEFLSRDDMHVNCSLLVCGVMLGCEVH